LTGFHHSPFTIHTSSFILLSCPTRRRFDLV